MSILKVKVPSPIILIIQWAVNIIKYKIQDLAECGCNPRQTIRIKQMETKS